VRTCRGRSRAVPPGAFVTGNIRRAAVLCDAVGLMFSHALIFVRGLRGSALAAGLRLSIVPVMLGVIAPVGGVLYDRLGSRLVTALGMLSCLAGLDSAVCREWMGRRAVCRW